MGLIVGRLEERKAADARAQEVLLDYLSDPERCPEYLTEEHKIAMGLAQPPEPDEDELDAELDEEDSDDEEEEKRKAEEEARKQEEIKVEAVVGGIFVMAVL